MAWPPQQSCQHGGKGPGLEGKKREKKFLVLRSWGGELGFVSTNIHLSRLPPFFLSSSSSSSSSSPVLAPWLIPVFFCCCRRARVCVAAAVVLVESFTCRCCWWHLNLESGEEEGREASGSSSRPPGLVVVSSLSLSLSPLLPSFCQHHPVSSSHKAAKSSQPGSPVFLFVLLRHLTFFLPSLPLSQFPIWDFLQH